jgi:hypothetical protein
MNVASEVGKLESALDLSSKYKSWKALGASYTNRAMNISSMMISAINIQIIS